MGRRASPLAQRIFLGVLSLATAAASEEGELASKAAFPDVPAEDPDASVALPPQPPRPGVPAESIPAPAPSAASPPVWTSPPSRPAPDPSVDRGDWRPTKRVWYGGQTLVVDGLSLGALLLSGGSNSGELAAFGGLGYLFGAPVVHAAHGHVGKPFASFGMRVGLPMGGLFLGCAAEGRKGGDFGCLGGAVIGFVLGGIAAISLDAAVVAYDERPDREAAHAPVIGLAPSVAVTKSQASLGLAGWF